MKLVRFSIPRRQFGWLANTSRNADVSWLVMFVWPGEYTTFGDIVNLPGGTEIPNPGGVIQQNMLNVTII